MLGTNVLDLSELLRTERQGKALLVVTCSQAQKDVISEYVQMETPDNGSSALMAVTRSQAQKDVVSDSVQRKTPYDRSPEPGEA